jgi:3-phosphoglycerate kinase
LSALDKDIFDFDDLKQMNRQLAKMGNNLNQVTMLAHQGRIKEVDLSTMSKELSAMSDKLCDLVERR